MSLVSILRPGFLVAFSVRATDTGLSYKRDELAPTVDADQIGENATVATWQNTRILVDAEEHEAAIKVQGKISALVRKVCTITPFGHFCTDGNFPDLLAAVDAAKDLADDHNASARYTCVRVFFRAGQVAATDEQAAKDIAGEMIAIVDRMNAAIDRLDPDAIREAVKEANDFSALLAPVQSEKVGLAVEAARKAARDITTAARRAKKVKDEDGIGDGTPNAAILLASLNRSALETARVAFLDFSENTEVPGESLAPVNTARVDALDLDDEPNGTTTRSDDAASGV